MSTEPSYTLLVRLPFPRGDFVDPPPVEWDAAKDKALWKILSKPPKNGDIDWNDLATKFNVSLPFLLQQAAWLYEHQLLQVREQIMKVDVSHPTAGSPAPGSTYEVGGGEAMARTGSGAGRETQLIPHRPARSDRPGNGADARAVSSFSAHRDSPNLNDAVPNATGRPTLQSSVAPHHQPPKPKRTPSQIQTHQEQRHALQSPLSSSPSSNSNSSSSSPSPAVPSRLSRRPPHLSSHRDKGNLSDDDEDDDDEPAFLPLASTTNDPSATLRDDPRNAARRPIKGKEDLSQASDSSTSSASPAMPRRTDGQRRSIPGPLSPRRTAELSRQKENSDGTPSLGSPSMGSSFSDLDDASVTQSALEEALASNMRAGGGMASRMSSISQALRSRYL